MVYTKQEKQEIEWVLAVFVKYLNQRDHCDIAWSNKLGYLLLDYHTYIDDVTPIGTAADLCREMLDYMMIDSVTKSKSGHLLKRNRRRGKKRRFSACGNHILSSCRSMNIFGRY